jgi:uncharacterized protein YheU (UPF0270 family)
VPGEASGGEVVVWQEETINAMPHMAQATRIRKEVIVCDRKVEVKRQSNAGDYVIFG